MAGESDDTEDRARKVLKGALGGLNPLTPLDAVVHGTPTGDDSKWESIGQGGDMNMPDQPAEGGTNQDVLGSGAGAYDTSRDAMYPLQLTPPNVGTIRGKQLDPFQVGGRGLIDQAAGVQHENAAQAVEQMGQDRSVEHKRLEGVYSEEEKRQTRAATIDEAQRQADQQEFQRRQAMLDKKADEIAMHRVDQGRFWKNPGSILSAIGASLMSLGSDDHTIGMKLINNAIEKDIEQQRVDHEYMQADLTGLRTNVGMFRQLVGDKQAGDMMHEAKMREVTAQKILQVAESLKSKEAKSAAMAEASMLRQQAAQLRVAINSKIYMAPKLVTPAMKRAEMAGGTEQAEPYQDPQQAPQGGMGLPETGGGPDYNPVDKYIAPQNRGVAPYAQQMSKQTDAGLRAPPGAVSYEDRQDTTTFPNGGQEGPGREGFSTNIRGDALSGTSQESVEPASVGGASGFKRPDTAIHLLEQRTGVKGIDKALAAERARNVLEATSVSNGNQKQFNEAMLKKQGDAMTKAEAIAAKHLPFAAYEAELGSFQNKFKALRESFGGDYEKMDSFLGQNYKFALGNQGYMTIQRLRDTVGGDKLSDVERRKAEKYAQDLGNLVNTYIKDMSGAAVNPSEDARRKLVISGDMSSRNIENWVTGQSKQRDRILADILASAGPQAAILWVSSKGIKGASVPSGGKSPNR